MSSCPMIYIPSSLRLVQALNSLWRGDTQTACRSHKPALVFFFVFVFFQNKESRLKWITMAVFRISLYVGYSIRFSQRYLITAIRFFRQSLYLWLYSPFVEPCRLFSSLILYTVSRILGRGDQPVARSLLTHRIHAHRCTSSGIRTHDRSQCFSRRRRFMFQTGRLLRSAI
jgi:hypothetical protein